MLVDVATLTGAMRTALGARTAGLYASTDGLADALLTAAGHAGEPFWRMPLTDEHVGHLRAQLHSAVADANNAPGDPGATTAEFTSSDVTLAVSTVIFALLVVRLLI